MPRDDTKTRDEHFRELEERLVNTRRPVAAGDDELRLRARRRQRLIEEGRQHEYED